MDRVAVEKEAAPLTDRSVDSGLKALWERVRRAADLIVSLRQENFQYQQKVEGLEADVKRLQGELLRREQLLRKASAELEQHEARRGAAFANGESEAIAAKIRELLTKLDSYL